MLRIPINEQGWGLFIQMMKNFAGSEVGGKAITLFAALLGLLFAVNGLNIVNSYVGRDFITAIAARNSPAYLLQALFYVGVFAASTVAAVLARYAEERLGLLWRQWMTQSLLRLYLQYPTYYRINDALIRKSGMENPDQRIADDVRVFTTSTLSFTLMLLNGIFTVLAFSGVLWSISPELFGVAVLYAMVGSYLAVRFGRPLIDLNYAQLDKEAAFRSGLIHVGQKAESLALLHREGPMLSRLSRQFDEVAGNFRKIITINRQLGFFSTGYNYLLQIIPALLVAPLFIEGDVEFGVITQSTMAFTMLVGAFSLIVTQFQSISSFAAVIERLINLWYAIELAQTETVSGMDVIEEEGRLQYERLTVRSATDGRALVQDLSISIAEGVRTLVTAPNDTVKDAFLKATAGILDTATGRISRPPLGQILFLPERPYLSPGSLRDALFPSGRLASVGDEAIIETLGSLGIQSVVVQAGGLDVEHDWDAVLSVNEQQLISFARILL
ncbi:MAG: transporter ATP-binding protein/permease, partial [Proteobacteria bacterium]|nr:transporter ATP-binding protein/permease [Pseudomonadota bacterium]